MADKKPSTDTRYYVKVAYEWGKANGSELSAESVGTMTWADLHYDQSVSLQNAVVIPGVKLMLDEAGVLGMETVDMTGGDTSALRAALEAKGKK